MTPLEVGRGDVTGTRKSWLGGGSFGRGPRVVREKTSPISTLPNFDVLGPEGQDYCKTTTGKSIMCLSIPPSINKTNDPTTLLSENEG